MFVISNCENAELVEKKVKQVVQHLGANADQIRVHEGKSKQFFEIRELKNVLIQQIAAGDSAF